MIGLPDHHPIDPPFSRDAEAGSERAALDEARKPQPLIEPPARGTGRIFTTDQASFSSRSLANGWPSPAGKPRWSRLAIFRSCRARVIMVFVVSSLIT